VTRSPSSPSSGLPATTSPSPAAANHAIGTGIAAVMSSPLPGRCCCTATARESRINTASVSPARTALSPSSSISEPSAAQVKRRFFWSRRTCAQPGHTRSNSSASDRRGTAPVQLKSPKPSFRKRPAAARASLSALPSSPCRPASPSRTAAISATASQPAARRSSSGATRCGASYPPKPPRSARRKSGRSALSAAAKSNDGSASPGSMSPSTRSRASPTSSGSENSRTPASVMTPSRTHPSAVSSAIAAATANDFGRSSHGSSIPRGLHAKADSVSDTSDPRWISGTVTSESGAASLHSRTHTPGPSRPARPARCSAESRAIGKRLRYPRPAR